MQTHMSLQVDGIGQQSRQHSSIDIPNASVQARCREGGEKRTYSYDAHRCVLYDIFRRWKAGRFGTQMSNVKCTAGLSEKSALIILLFRDASLRYLRCKIPVQHRTGSEHDGKHLDEGARLRLQHRLRRDGL